MENQRYTRGQLSSACDVNIETIRYYEKIELLEPPRREKNGYRVYNNTHHQHLLFIKRCRELGFTLDDIRDFLSLVKTNRYTCRQVRNLTASHLQDIKVKIRDLKRLERTLSKMIDNCDNSGSTDCPIVEKLLS